MSLDTPQRLRIVQWLAGTRDLTLLIAFFAPVPAAIWLGLNPADLDLTLWMTLAFQFGSAIVALSGLIAMILFGVWGYVQTLRQLTYLAGRTRQVPRPIAATFPSIFVKSSIRRLLGVSEFRIARLAVESIRANRATVLRHKWLGPVIHLSFVVLLLIVTSMMVWLATVILDAAKSRIHEAPYEYDVALRKDLNEALRKRYADLDAESAYAFQLYRVAARRLRKNHPELPKYDSDESAERDAFVAIIDSAAPTYGEDGAIASTAYKKFRELEPRVLASKIAYIKSYRPPLLEEDQK